MSHKWHANFVAQQITKPELAQRGTDPPWDPQEPMLILLEDSIRMESSVLNVVVHTDSLIARERPRRRRTEFTRKNSQTPTKMTKTTMVDATLTIKETNLPTNKINNNMATAPMHNRRSHNKANPSLNKPSKQQAIPMPVPKFLQPGHKPHLIRPSTLG